MKKVKLITVNKVLQLETPNINRTIKAARTGMATTTSCLSRLAFMSRIELGDQKSGLNG